MYNKSSNISFYVFLVLPLQTGHVLMEFHRGCCWFGLLKAGFGMGFSAAPGSAPKNEAAGEGCHAAGAEMCEFWSTICKIRNILFIFQASVAVRLHHIEGYVSMWALVDSASISFQRYLRELLDFQLRFWNNQTSHFAILRISRFNRYNLIEMFHDISKDSPLLGSGFIFF